MDLELSSSEVAFRDRVRAFLATSLPERNRTGAASSPSVFGEPDRGEDRNAVVNRQGWLGYQWPVDLGGTGWTATEHYLSEKECALAGEDNRCQGFSEAGSGSDLASLQSSAVKTRNCYIQAATDESDGRGGKLSDDPQWKRRVATPRYLNSRAWTIFGGTNEIQSTIIAKTVLSLG